MRAPIYQVDAFAREVLAGNPAAVVVLEAWPSDGVLAGIAAENNLSETAFLVAEGSGEADYALRWFTPTVEVDLCGHATLASGHVLMRHLGFAGERVHFATRSGVVAVERDGERLALEFPVVRPVGGAIDEALVEALGARPDEVVVADPAGGTPSYVAAVFSDEEKIRALDPDFRLMGRMGGPGRGNVIVTAPGEGEVDFVSRFFAPGSGIDEDPVTGSVHCLLTAYWAQRLEKKSLFARQVSRRGGELWCTLTGERVRIGGYAVTYMVGEIEAPG